MEKISATHITIIFIFLTLVVFALGIYLGMLLAKLRQQSIQTAQMKKLFEFNLKEREQYLKDSIITIARASVNEQCELSEACIRLKKLLENYPELESKEEFLIITQMYNDLSEFAYLEERDKLTTKQRFEQDKKRYKLEDKYRPEMVKSLNLLLAHFAMKQ